MKLNSKEVVIGKLNIKFVRIYTIILLIMAFTMFEIGYCNNSYFNNLINGITTNYNFSLCRIIGYCAIMILYFVFRKKFEEDAIETSKNQYKTILVYFAVISLLFIFMWDIIEIANYHEIVRKATIIVLTVITGNLFVIYVSNNHIKNVIVALCTLGMVFSITTDFNHVADERKHFATAYNIAFFNFDYINNPITDSKLEELGQQVDYTKIDDYLKETYKPQTIDANKEDIYSTPTTYSKILYIPAAIGIRLATMLGGSIIDVYIYGRVFNLIFYSILICIALKLLPFKKNIFCTIFLMPLLMLYAASYSVDSQCVGLVAIFIAYCLKLYKECKTISLKQAIILLGLFLLMLLAKSMAYVMVCLIVFLLPLKNTLKKNKKYIPIIITALAIVLIIGTVLIVNVVNNLETDTRGLGNSNVNEQLKYISENPLSLVKLAVNHTKVTLLNYNWISELYHHAFFTASARNVAFVMLLFVLYVAITEDDINFKKKEKMILILAFLATIAVTSMPLYISYTQVGASYIDGYQTRYIFPILPLILMCVSNDKIKNTNKENRTLKLGLGSGLFIIIGLIQLAM